MPAIILLCMAFALVMTFYNIIASQVKSRYLIKEIVLWSAFTVAVSMPMVATGEKIIYSHVTSNDLNIKEDVFFMSM